ncbi:AAA family ATPase [Gracilibacillus phocaeensis]|uniref:AAA family ATPase n=1 Tax=Gracilibacillus phocaeensis TaxID=2042304 RepID=UPI001031F6B5|nr:AAA family ATPase [Gracilibacillus phocaeensis]
MRAIKLELTAFGPYRNKQVIDFSKLGEEPIFLITGPTGAGKTTIFDAICYSLYGKASGMDRDQEAFRSHFAEVGEPTFVQFTFQLHDSLYCVTRSPKQQKLKARGEGYTEEVAAASLYQCNALGEWVLQSSKIKDVNEAIESMIGLDYEQFKKMIMIPQGEFRKLISENSREREEILQKIFRTHFYQQMTEAFKEKASKLSDEIAKLDWKYQQAIAKLPSEWIDQALPADVTDQLEDRLRQLTEQKQQEEHIQTELAEKLQRLQEAYYQMKQLLEVFQQYEQLQQQQAELISAQPTVNKHREELELAKIADQVYPLEQQAKEREEERQIQYKQLQTLTQQYQQSEENYQDVKRRYVVEKDREQERTDLQFELKKQQELLSQMDRFHRLQEKLQTSKVKLDQEEKDSAEWGERLEKLDQLRKKIYQDKDELQFIKERTFELFQQQEKYKQVIQMVAEFVQKERERQELGEQVQKESQRVKELQSKQKQQEETCHHIEIQQQEQLSSYLATTLTSGEACPVCGSTTHPSPAEPTDALVLQDELEQAKQRLRDIQQETNQAELAVLQVEQSLKNNQQQRQHMADQLEWPVTDRSLDDIQQHEQQLEEKRQQLNDEHKRLMAEQETITTRLSANQQEVDRYDEYKQQQMNIEQKHQATQQEYHQYAAEYKQLQQQMPEHIDSDQAFQDKVASLEKEVTQQIQAWENIQLELETALTDKNKKESAYHEAVKYDRQLQEKAEAAKQQFHQTLLEYGFKKQADYQEALRSSQEKVRLEEVINRHNKQKDLVQHQMQELDKQIAQKQKPDLAKADKEIQQVSAEKELANERLQHRKQQLQQLQETIGQTNQLTKEKKELEKEYLHVGELADLARGDNSARLSLERFVLATFLDEIVLQANLRLSQMTDHRFQLLRSESLAKRGAQSGLDLEVLDHYTGKQRSVKTLSGGEGFKTALSLALGMADIVQAHAGGVQLDTLFIDEGFGTLDEVSLEQAIKCLKDLQQDHRTIGVISHVAQLKEEIKAKLVIETSPSGSSAAFRID